MSMTERFEVPSEDPEGKLERALMEEYLRSKKHSFSDLHTLPETERRHLLEAAALYADKRLAEVGARAHYVENLHRHG
jgi:hypothetical protein